MIIFRNLTCLCSLSLLPEGYICCHYSHKFDSFMELFVVPCLMPTACCHYLYKFDIFILPDQLHAAHIACCHYSYTCYNCLKLISPPLTPTACCHYLYKFDNYIWPASVLFCALCLLSLSRCDTCCHKSPPLHGQLPAVTT